MTEWRSVVGWENLYAVSDDGQVMSLPRTVVRKNGSPLTVRRRILKPAPHPFGYMQVVLCDAGYSITKTIHQLVAMAFIPRICDTDMVDHIDGRPDNNIVSNLRWVSCADNQRNRHSTIAVSEIVGVYRSSIKSKPWKVQGRRADHKYVYVGSYETKELAASAYEQFKLKQMRT